MQAERRKSWVVMRFHRRARYDRPSSMSKDGAYLEADNWDDFGYKTLWTLFVVRDGQVHEIGGVKIADRTGSAKPTLPERFPRLTDEYFSLGQDEDYYERLNALGAQDRSEILTNLND